MAFLFLKSIIKSIKLGLNIIYLDETSFCLNNLNLRMRRKDKGEIVGSAKTKRKVRINLIMGIDTKEIIYAHYYYNDTITTEEFWVF